MALDAYVAEVRQKNGFKFAVVKGTPADHASWWSFDDEQEVRDRHWHPKPGDTVLDIGAAFGSYTLPALVAGARVVCFSPADFDTELLEKNLSLNPEFAARCLVVRDGLYSGNGWFDPDHCKFQDRMPSIANKASWLQVRSLDSFLEERPGIDRVDWMKLDVEGAEYEVLQGAINCLTRDYPSVLIECHKFHDPNMETKVIGLMEGLGYKTQGPFPHTAVSHVFFHVT